MTTQQLRSIAIYRRLHQKFPTFTVLVEEFSRGGGKEGSPPTTGQLMHWAILPGKTRSFVRGTSVESIEAKLHQTLQEAWRTVRRWS